MVSVICVVCGAYGGRVVRKSMPRNSANWKAAGSARLVFVGVSCSECTARLDSVPGETLRA